MATGGSKGGLLVALLNGLVYGTLDKIEYVLTNPAKGLMHCANVWVWAHRGWPLVDPDVVRARRQSARGERGALRV